MRMGCSNFCLHNFFSPITKVVTNPIRKKSHEKRFYSFPCSIVLPPTIRRKNSIAYGCVWGTLFCVWDALFCVWDVVKFCFKNFKIEKNYKNFGQNQLKFIKISKNCKIFIRTHTQFKPSHTHKIYSHTQICIVYIRIRC